MTRYEAQAMAALGAVEVRAPDAFLWFGRREATGSDQHLVRRIAQRLHADFFSAGSPRPRRGGPVTAPDEGGAFVRALSQANGGRGAWQGGWRTAGPAGNEVLRVVAPDGLALLAPLEQVRVEGDVAGAPAGPEHQAGAGGPAMVLLPKELRGLSPGFYIALGDSGAPSGDALAGLYWNVAAAGAVTLVARVTYALNGAGLAFSFALLDNPARYGRGDAAVLVVARADVPAATKLLRPLLRALGPHLADAAPAFTKPLTRGLALAEVPPGGGTARFGEQRCRLLAEAIVAAGAAGARTADARLAIVREHFAAAGVSLEAPYLQPGSSDVYARS